MKRRKFLGLLGRGAAAVVAAPLVPAVAEELPAPTGWRSGLLELSKLRPYQLRMLEQLKECPRRAGMTFHMHTGAGKTMSIAGRRAMVNAAGKFLAEQREDGLFEEFRERST